MCLLITYSCICLPFCYLLLGAKVGGCNYVIPVKTVEKNGNICFGKLLLLKETNNTLIYLTNNYRALIVCQALYWWAKLDLASNLPSLKGRPLSSSDPSQLETCEVSGFIIFQHRDFRQKRKTLKLFIIEYLSNLWNKKYLRRTGKFMSSLACWRPTSES